MTRFCTASLILSSVSVVHAISVVHPMPCGLGGNQSCRPLMMLALGPTGSGKSSQEEQLKKLFSLRTNQLITNPPKMLLVDEFVEKDPGYRAKILAFLRAELGQSPARASVDHWVASANDTVYNIFADYYFGCRTQWGCNMTGKGGCKAAFNRVVNRSLTAGNNVIWEATGKDYPDDKIAQAVESENNYTVVVGVNALDFCALKDRNSRRATGSIMEFMEEPDNLNIAAPRLPDLRGLDKAVTAIIDQTSKIIDCVGMPFSTECPGKIDELYVFDNEHKGFLPSIKIVVPAITDAGSMKAFHSLKDQAKNMLNFMHPRPCGTSAEIIV